MKCLRRPEIAVAIQYTGDNEEEVKTYAPVLFYDVCFVHKGVLHDHELHKGDYIVHEVSGFTVMSEEEFNEAFEVVDEGTGV
jgi:hypothetical protein